MKCIGYVFTWPFFHVHHIKTHIDSKEGLQFSKQWRLAFVIVVVVFFIVCIIFTLCIAEAIIKCKAGVGEKEVECLIAETLKHAPAHVKKKAHEVTLMFKST